VHDLHPEVYKQPPSSLSSLISLDIPLERQRFLALYILQHVAKPARPPVTAATTATSGATLGSDRTSQTIMYPKTETDQLVASLLPIYEQYLRQTQTREQIISSSSSSSSSSLPSSSSSECGVVLGPDLIFALAYWKSLRTGNWIQRERLLCEDDRDRKTSSTRLPPVSWEQRLMIRHSIGDSLGSARAITVATMNKAYYSLPVAVMAHAVGLTSKSKLDRVAGGEDDGDEASWVRTLKSSSYGLVPSIIVRDGNLMFKAKS
jgi:hypothetical protein